MHPLLQPTRTQRIVNHAIDAAGAAFAIALLCVILGGVIAALAL